jgi:protein required for attachment to host cells
MTYSHLSTGTHIVVGDGKKALILVNEGTAFLPVLTVESVLSQSDPQNHEMGTDRPSLVYASVGHRSGGPEPTDWHQLAEDKFAHEIIAGLIQLAEREKLKRLVIVAPARTLAELRRAMPEAFSKLIVAEIVKDLTKHSVGSIAEHLIAEMAA